MRRLIPFVAVLLTIPVFAWALGGATDPTYVYNQARHFVSVSPSDTVDLIVPSQSIYTAGTAGGVACVLVVIGVNDTSSVTFTNIQPGSFSPIAVKRIL